MKKIRVKRGSPSMIVPDLPTDKIFFERCSQAYGDKTCDVYSYWGYMNRQDLYKLMKSVCEKPIAINMQALHSTLTYYGFKI